MPMPLAHRIVCTTALTLLVGMASAGRAANRDRSEPPDVKVDTLDMLAEGEAAFSQSEAQSWRDEVLPHVEAFAGKSFLKPPAVLVVDRKTMLMAWERDIRQQLGLGAADEVNDEQATKVMLLVLETLEQSPFMFARYCLSDRVIHVPAGNTRPLLGVLSLDGESTADIMKIVIAHELAHALHAEHIAVGSAQAPRSEDERKALDAVAEGFAMLVQTGVAARLHLSELNARLIAASQLDDVQIQSAAAPGRRYREVYVAGLRFFEHHFARAGMDGVWTILAQPPRTYAHIAQPERLGEKQATSLSVTRLFAGLDQAIGDGKQGKSMAIGGESAGRPFAAQGTDHARRAASAIANAYVWMVNVPPHVRAVTCYELQDGADAGELINLMDMTFTKRFGPMQDQAKKMGGVVTEQRLELGVVNAAGFIRTVSIVNGRDSVDTGGITFAAGARDRHVVQVVLSGEEVAAEPARAVVDMLLARMASDEARVAIPAIDASDELVSALRRIKPMLGEAEWMETIRPQPRSAVEKLIGDDPKGHMALESDWVKSQAIALEAASDPGSSRRILMTALMQFSNDASAEAACRAIGANLGAAFTQFRQVLPDISDDDITQSTRPSGEPCFVKEAAFTYMGNSMQIAAMATHRGRYVVYVLDTNNALGAERINDLITALARDLP